MPYKKCQIQKVCAEDSEENVRASCGARRQLQTSELNFLKIEIIFIKLFSSKTP
jgi:hypothetical protein